MGDTATLSRKDEILQALARMLETSPGTRITTAALAREVGVSEAALYRHFPSKARMFEELLGFAEQTLFSLVNEITASGERTDSVCGKILLVTLTFAERNPGITRMLCGDALHGEKERLRIRADQLFDRLESELRNAIRLGEVREQLTTALPPGAASALMINLVEGKLRRYLRSGYREPATADWDRHWQVIAPAIFR